MRIICASNEKGGVGKTTTAVNLGHGLALRGHAVLIVDTDAQGNCAPSLGIEAAENTLAEVLLGKCTWQEAIIEVRPRFHLLASGPRLAESKDQLITLTATKAALASVDGQIVHPPNYLRDNLTALDEFDYVIIDCAPSRDIINKHALRFASEVLMPVSVDYLATVGAGQHMMAVRDAQEGGADIILSYVVPTFVDKRTIKSREILADLEDFFGNAVTEPIPSNVSVAEAPSFGQTIFEYAPHSTGAAAYAKLVERVAADG